MKHILTTHEVKNEKFDLLYLDLKYDIKTDNTAINRAHMSRNMSENENSLSVHTLTKSGVLPLRDSDFDIDKYVGKYLSENIKTVPIPHIKYKDRSLFSFTISDYELNVVCHKLIQKLKSLSYFIASEGRMGGANCIVLNKNTYDTWILNSLDEFINIDFFINNEINDNEIILIHNGDITQPGYKLLYYNDKNNNLYLDIVSIGWFPDKQAYKFIIYE